MADLSMSVTIIGADTLAAAFEDASGICQGALADAINKTAFEVEAEAKRNAPHDKGQLIASIHTNPAYPSNDEIKAEVGTNLEYAIDQEYGTGIYSEYPGAPKTVITPKSGKALRWVGSDGQVHFAKSVKGVKPVFFMKQAKEKGMPILINHMQAALGVITAQLAR